MESEGGTDKKTETEEKNQNNVLETDETEEERHDKNPGEEDTVSQHKDSPSAIDTEEGSSTLEKEKGTKDDNDLPNIEVSQLETNTHLTPEEGVIKPTVEDTVEHSILSSQVSLSALENESDSVHEETTTIPHSNLSEVKKSPHHHHANTVMEQEHPAEEHDITAPGDNNETSDITKFSEGKGSPLLQHHANDTVMEQDMLASGDHTEFPDTKVVEVNSETIDEPSDMNLADHDQRTTTEFENLPGSETVSNLENNPSQLLIETSVNVENDQNSDVLLPAGVPGDCDKGTSSDHNEGGATLEPEPLEAMELDVPDSKLATDAGIDSTINNNDVNVEAPNAERKDYSIVLVPEGSGAGNESTSVTREAGPPCVPSSDTKSEVGVSESLNNGVHKIGPPKRSFLSDDTSEGNESGTEEDQSAFTKELSQFFRERNMDFKPPKFYGEGLNCLKLWRAVVRLGGYDKVTGFKLWRQVGESFRPPKTCTTVSWTFRGFYEKTLLEYERQKVIAGELQIPLAIDAEPMNIDNQAFGSGRARRDAAARAMQGWHSQLLNGNGEVNEPAVQDNNLVLHQKREKSMGTSSPGLLKRKRLTSTEHVAKHAIQVSRPMLDVTVVDVGPPAQWVKINVQRTQDCFEVYALVPGLVREEVRVQSDPAGRLVISGEPENPMNPWGATPFKKVVSLPTRIDPHHTSAVVTLNGQLFVRVPLEQSD